MTKEEMELREHIERVAAKHIERGDATGWFEELYSTAGGDIDAIPWLDLEPNRFLVEWDDGKLVDGNGRRAMVVGCGLGDEAKYLYERGFKVTAFDISETAIDWARRLHAATDIEFQVADIFDLPLDWKRAFDLVVEVYTIQALPLAMRDGTIDSIADLVALGGRLVAVQHLRDENILEPEGPPWAVSREELKRFESNGLREIEFETYFGDEEEPVERFVSLFSKGGLEKA